VNIWGKYDSGISAFAKPKDAQKESRMFSPTNVRDEDSCRGFGRATFSGSWLPAK
jgi:hypothetical protein